jgi:hypothetical protein
VRFIRSWTKNNRKFPKSFFAVEIIKWFKKGAKAPFLLIKATKTPISLMFTKNVDLLVLKSHKCNFVTKNNIGVYFIYALKLIL